MSCPGSYQTVCRCPGCDRYGEAEEPDRNRELARRFGVERRPLPKAYPNVQGTEIESLIQETTDSKEDIKRAINFVDRCCDQLLDSPCLSFQESDGSDMEGWGNHDGKRYWDSKTDRRGPCGPCAPCAPPLPPAHESDLKRKLDVLVRQLKDVVEGIEESERAYEGCCCANLKNVSRRKKKGSQLVIEESESS